MRLQSQWFTQDFQRTQLLHGREHILTASLHTTVRSILSEVTSTECSRVKRHFTALRSRTMSIRSSRSSTRPVPTPQCSTIRWSSSWWTASRFLSRSWWWSPSPGRMIPTWSRRRRISIITTQPWWNPGMVLLRSSLLTVSSQAQHSTVTAWDLQDTTSQTTTDLSCHLRSVYLISSLNIS